MLTGFDRADGIGADVLALAESCRDAGTIGPGPGGTPARSPFTVQVPGIGEVDAQGLALPLFTMVIAGSVWRWRWRPIGGRGGGRVAKPHEACLAGSAHPKVFMLVRSGEYLWERRLGAAGRGEASPVAYLQT